MAFGNLSLLPGHPKHFIVQNIKGLGFRSPFYTWTMHMPGTEAPTVLWTRATRLPQIAKTDQLVIPSFRMQRPCGYNSKIPKP